MKGSILWKKLVCPGQDIQDGQRAQPKARAEVFKYFRADDLRMGVQQVQKRILLRPGQGVGQSVSSSSASEKALLALPKAESRGISRTLGLMFP